MNKKYTLAAVCLMLMALAGSALAVSPSVTNVQAFQQQNAGRKVQIDYTLTDPDSSSVYVTVTISTDNGATYTITPSTATGDIGWVRTGGTRTIVWDAKAQYPTGKWSACKAKVTADDSTGGVYPGQMIYIPAGSFLMGNSNVGNDAVYHYSSELPQHSVYLSAYSIGKYEVTRGEYRAFMNATGRAAPYCWDAVQDFETGSFTQTDNHPVVGVTWYDAQAFCTWAGGHLPTEAEWERAARWTGSHPNVYPWGDTWGDEKCNNWCDTNPAGGGYGKYQTAPVGSYSSYPSPSGCQDMAGNVWEWCQDWYKSYPGSSSPFDYTNSYRVLRGGGCSSIYVDYYTRCAFRNYFNPYYSDMNGGFRLAR